MVILKVSIAAIILFGTIRIVDYIEKNIITEYSSKRLDRLLFITLLVTNICTAYIIYQLVLYGWPLLKSVLHS